MSDHAAPPYRHAVVLHVALRVEAVDDDTPYAHCLNGVPRDCLPPARWYPLPVFYPEVGCDDAWRRFRFEVVR